MVFALASVKMILALLLDQLMLEDTVSLDSTASLLWLVTPLLFLVLPLLQIQLVMTLLAALFLLNPASVMLPTLLLKELALPVLVDLKP
jgi:hypothetical protein